MKWYPQLLYLLSGSTHSHYVTADYIPYAVLPIPVTFYQLLICTSLTLPSFHPDPPPHLRPSPDCLLYLWVCFRLVCWQGYQEKGTLIHRRWDCKLVQPLWKTVWRFRIKKKRMDLPFHSAVALLGIYLKKTKTLIHKDLCIPMFTAALFTIAKIWKQTMGIYRQLKT